jgi:hypothetical protein
MSRRLALIAALASTVAAGALVASPASAGNVAWSVSVGVPGLAVSAGAPAYGLAAPLHGPAYGYGPYRPYYRTYAPAPVVIRAPVVALYPYAFPASVVVAPRVHARHRAAVAPYAYFAPRPIPYGWN